MIPYLVQEQQLALVLQSVRSIQKALQLPAERGFLAAGDGERRACCGQGIIRREGVVPVADGRLQGLHACNHKVEGPRSYFVPIHSL